MAVPEWLSGDERLRHHHHRPAQPGCRLPYPDWVGAEVREALARVGVTELWQHQVLAAEAAHAGRHVAMATGTASGKTLGYLLPILASASGGPGFAVPSGPLGLDRGHSAIYLSPTKALAHDQLRMWRSLEVPDWRPVALDGDSEEPERRFARDFGQLIATNPDMLHRSVLPRHQYWSRVLSTLRYVVVDEAHRYRGVFGAHVSMVLRRLRRIARHYGADPVFISASATVADAGDLLSRLAGVAGVVEVTADTSARPELDFLLWQPSGDAHHETAELLARLVADDRQTLAFTTSRVQAELVARRAQESLGRDDTVRAYRGGYLASDRRALEAGLQSGKLRGVASTNALELGVDISGVDAVLTCGFPGTLAALWQQAGRAGRSGRGALAVLIARADPLDAFLCAHPGLVFDAPVERTVLHPENPQVLALHVAAAAQELPVTEVDAEFFTSSLPAVLERLIAAGYLRRRANGWYWTRPDRAVDTIDLRSSGGDSIEVVEAATGRVLGQVDPAAADRTVHTGAVYLHQGDSWRVSDYEPADHTALVVPSREGYFTQALGTTDLRILERTRERRLGAADVGFGMVELSGQVTGFLRRDELTGAELPGAAHAAEHTAIGLLPAFAPCDRWDIGGLSMALHPDTGALTVFVHDGAAGGAGFAERGYDLIEPWLTATLERLRTCACEAGCPASVVSPKCGNGNQPLDKQAAARLLGLLVG